jgi:hypothetical protein
MRVAESYLIYSTTLLTLCCFSVRMLQRRGKMSSHTLSASAVSMWHSWAVANRNCTVLVLRIDSIILDWRRIRCANAALRVRPVGCSSPFWSTDPTVWRSISISSCTRHEISSGCFALVPQLLNNTMHENNPIRFITVRVILVSGTTTSLQGRGFNPKAIYEVCDTQRVTNTRFPHILQVLPTERQPASLSQLQLQFWLHSA